MTGSNNSTGSDDAADDASGNILEDLFTAVPRLVLRTRAQAELALRIAGQLPCLGPAVRHRTAGALESTPPDNERSDVLSLLVIESTDDAEDHDMDPESAQGVTTAGDAGNDTAAPFLNEPGAEIPAAADLAIPGYDSLAASQVVPRLVTLSEAELRSIGAYESIHRHRQTILNRVTQLLVD